MAIRPTDLQSALIVSTQAAPTQQRLEQAPLSAQAAQQAAFVSKTDERNERVAETTDLQGNRIGVRERDQPDQQEGGRGRKRERKPGDPFDEVVEEAAGLSDGTAHLIDYSA
jgi:hypothetical protein